ncbi:MAG: Flp family type IVb pilin [Thermoleophilia bacterium]|nr:Flp family type IVb pilin [Thermoleophilia bacterium]
MMALLKRLFYEEDGQSMVEYGLILALVAVVVIVALTTLGDKLKDLFAGTSDKIVAPTSD